MHILLPVLTLAAAPLASAWGSLGHSTVAYLAQKHFTTQANKWVNSMLVNEDIADAINWPDVIARDPAYIYTKQWHYIDANDNPPYVCGLNFTRDCLGSCAVSALMNNTARVNNQSLTSTDRVQALKFVMHIIGDIHQPLHTERAGYGGNTIYVTFDGIKTNLHAVWDYLIPNKWALNGQTNEKLAAQAWASRLYFAEPLSECIDNIKDCSLDWAAEANFYICSYLLKDGVSGLPQDLGGDYYKGATGIVDYQIQKGARRLAAWINLLAPASSAQEEL